MPGVCSVFWGADRLKSITWIGLLCTSLTFMGCQSEVHEADDEVVGVSRVATTGPVDVRLSATPATLMIDQQVHIELEVIADKDVTVLDSPYETALRGEDYRYECRVARVESQLAQPTQDGRLRWTYRFDVEFFLPGDHEIPGAEIEFVDLTGHTGDDAPVPTAEPEETQSVSTDPLTVVVIAGEGSDLSEADLRIVPRLDPIELPQKWTGWWWVIPVAVVAVLAMMWWLLKHRRRADSPDVMRIPAHEWASRQLSELIAEDLIRKHRVQEFYYRVSGIVRGYIERRFNVSAPEMTTEEFLASALRDRRFGAETTQELGGFLTACDRVKYACHTPQDEEAHGAIHAASDFVEKTRMREPIEDGAEVPAEERAA